MLSRDAGPWGPMELRMSARFWSPKEDITFSELLDGVEAGLRLPPVQSTGETVPHKTVNAASEN